MKAHSFTSVLAGCVLGVAIALFGLNFWHSMNFSHDPDQHSLQLEALQKRLLHSESQSLQNTILINKLLHLIQIKLFEFESKQIEELTKQSRDEAIRIALILDKHPAPPMLDYDLDDKYKSKEALSNLVDDVFKYVDDKSNDIYSYGKDASSTSSSSSSSGESPDSEGMSDADSIRICSEWKVKYSVVVGVSWGDLPYDLQQRWISHSCDYHVQEDRERERASEAKGHADVDGSSSPESVKEPGGAFGQEEDRPTEGQKVY